MTEVLQNRGNTLVATGAFAPAMFHPSWFKRYELLGNNEVNAASGLSNLLVSDELSLFKVAGFDFDIRPTRMQIGTSLESLFEPTRDLMASVLSTLDGAPVKQIGINWTAHYATQSKTAWHAAGDILVPKHFWNSIWPKHVGMSNLSLELQRSDGHKGSVNVVFQPSSLVTNGIYVSINDHYDLKEAKEDDEVYSADAAKHLQNVWAKSREMADKLFADVYQEVTK